jgi:hypothetical protein
MQPSMLSLLAAFAVNIHPPLPPPQLSLPLGCHHRHRHHHGQTQHCPLLKKEERGNSISITSVPMAAPT